MKKKQLIFCSIILCFLVLAVIKDQAVKITVGLAAKKVLGADVAIGGLSLGIFRPRIVIKDLKVYNPQGFPKAALIDIPRISVEYDLPALLQKKVYLKRLELNLKNIIVLKNKDGKLNIDSLKVSEKEDKPVKKQSAMPFKIDYLVLTVGQVVYKDYSAGEKPRIEAFDVNLKDRVYKNINDPRQLAILAISEAMRQTTIKAAGIYGAAGLAGVAVLPFAAAVIATSKDNVDAVFALSWDKVFSACSQALKESGRVTLEDKANGLINGEAGGSNIAVKLEKSGNKIKVVITAREYFLPKKEIAAGLLYQVSEKLGR